MQKYEQVRKNPRTASYPGAIRGFFYFLLLPPHLPQEAVHRRHGGQHAIQNNGQNVPSRRLEIAANQGFFHFHGMNEGKHVGDFLESSSNQGQIKPHARQPCGQIGQQSAANSTNLLYAQQAAAQQPQRNVKDRHGDDPQHGIKHVDAQRPSQGNGHQIADQSLRQRHGQEGEQIS